jgi:hypothetical protein
MRIAAEEGSALTDEIWNGSDRVCAFVVAAHLDARLSSALCAWLGAGKDKKTFETVFERMTRPTGPLGGFHNRANMAYLIGMISAETKADLKRIADIRNEFAHLPGNAHFGAASIRKECEKLSAYDRTNAKLPWTSSKPVIARPFNQRSARLHFTHTASQIVDWLVHSADAPHERSEFWFLSQIDEALAKTKMNGAHKHAPGSLRRRSHVGKG